MSHFSPTEVDTLLNGKAPKTQANDLPAGFFDDMEKRILAAALAAPSDGDSEMHSAPATTETSAAAGNDPTAARIVPTATPTVAMRPHHTSRKWLYAAAAVLLLGVCTFAVKYSHQSASPTPTAIEGTAQNYAIDDDIYAVNDDMTDDEIDDLFELYEADVFLEEL